MRLAPSRCVLSVTIALAACGGSNSPVGTIDAPSGMVDAPGQNIGFAKPTMPLQANTETSLNNWMSLGSADLSCLGSANADQATTIPVELDTVVQDFQEMTPLAGAAVTWFNGVDPTALLGSGTADGSGNIAIDLPTGTTRFGIEMTDDQDFNTLLLNQKVAPSMAVQTMLGDGSNAIQIVSKETGATLPALIGLTRTPGTGIVAGALRDCSVHEMSNFVAVTSSTQGTATPIAGAISYYFSDAVGLPVHHNQQASSSADGLFMSIQIPVTTTAYVQAWGYPTPADLAADNLTLISELAVPVLADTVVTGSFEPLRAQ